MFSLPKSDRLRKKAEFTAFFQDSQRLDTPYFRVYFSKKGGGHSKVAFVSGKMTGNAVCRNRSKRLLREIYRRNKVNISESNDYLLSAKKEMLGTHINVLETKFLECMRRIK